MSHRITRRTFVQTASASAVGVWLGTAGRARAQSANDKLNVAVIGLGGMGERNLNAVRGENVVALCDVDDVRAGNAYQRFPQAKKFYDFRAMFDEMEKQIDAVAISTPDHTHFHPTYWALERGKHVYLEKPMAHNVWEVRKLTELAAEKKVATQLGVQRHVNRGLREAVELIHAGAIGTVTECHCWIDGNRGMPRIPTDTPPVPDTLKWDLWVGPASERPYHPSIAPYGWRFWWDYGTGETGNWGCHILDIPFWALHLKYPTRVEASGPEVHELTTPTSFTSRFDFPAQGDRGPVSLHWYHGTPPVLRERGVSGRGRNTLFIGSEGMLLCGFDNWDLLPGEKFADYRRPASTLYRSPGFHQEWFNACKGDDTPPSCNFDYSGPMTETVLLGNVAYRAGGAFEWDHENLQAKGNDNAAKYIREEYRKGWEI